MAQRRPVLKLSLKWKLMLLVSTLLLGTCTILSLFLIGEFSEHAVTSLEHHAVSLAGGLAHNAEFGVMLEIKTELDALLRGLLQDEDVLFVQIYNSDGALLSSAYREPIDSANIPELVYTQAENATEIDSSRASLKTTQLLGGVEVIDAVAPVCMLTETVTKEELGTTRSLMQRQGERVKVIGFARVGVGLQKTYTRIEATTRMIIIFSLLLVILGILLSIMLVKMISKPIDEMVAATELTAAADLSQRVAVAADPELARLADAFNQMCDSLQQTQREIESYNQTLEQKIRERTRELEQAQKQIIQSEKMAAVGQLAAGVAHELNNPLGGILGYAQFGLEKLQKGRVDEQDVGDYQRYLGDIEVQARRCKMIVKNLLKFSRASSKAEFERFEVNSVLEETFVFSQHQLDMNNVSLVKRLAPNLPEIYGNANLLQQVFANMLLNGMQAMPDGGELVVETRLNPAKGAHKGSIEIQFRDNGVGISEENLPKIFEPFFTTKKVGQGTGLGLSVSYGIVKEHGGDITIDSKVGEGSTFTVLLPIVSEKVNAEVAT
jgi:two-component system NtrC family sensor kinase